MTLKVLLPRQVMEDAEAINVAPEPAVSRGDENFDFHNISWGADAGSLAVQTPLLHCHGVHRTSDGRVHMITDIGTGAWRDMMRVVDAAIIAAGADILGLATPEVAALRYLSAMQVQGKRNRLKLRVPMLDDDTPNVLVCDPQCHPLDSTALLSQGKLKGAQVACVVGIDAMWVLRPGHWFGANWVVRQVLLKTQEEAAFLPLLADEEPVQTGSEKTDGVEQWPAL